MSFFKNILSSKLSVITFIVLPFFIVLLVLAWVYMFFFQVPSLMSQDQSTSPLVEVNTPPNQFISQVTQTSSSKTNSTKASFDDLEKSKPSIKSQSSIIILSSPIKSTPEADVVEINTLLDKINMLDNDNDAVIDNQILQN